MLFPQTNLISLWIDEKGGREFTEGGSIGIISKNGIR
jgi:hypothetical protein